MNKKLLLCCILTLTLLLGACSLAQEPKEETEQKEDRFAGLYLVWEEDGRSYEYDILTADAKNFDGFSGLKGYSLITAEIGSGEDRYSTCYCDLQNGHFKTNTTDNGKDYELTGTLYFSEKLRDRILHVYQVFQKEDGTLYLDGNCDSYAVADGMGVTTEATTKADTNGETTQESRTKIEFQLKQVEQAEKTILRQYAANGELLCSDEINPDMESLLWAENATWAVVEECFAEKSTHTAYDRTEETEIKLVTVDESGIGTLVHLPIK